jgi:hypothetical protein
MRRLACLIAIPLLFDAAFALLLSQGGQTPKAAPDQQPTPLLATQLAKDVTTERIGAHSQPSGVTLLLR